MNLGVLAQVRGDLDTAIKLLRQAAAISEHDPITCAPLIRGSIITLVPSTSRRVSRGRAGGVLRRCRGGSP